VADSSDRDTSAAGEEYPGQAVRGTHWILTAFILVAAALRLFLLEDQSLWYDEGFSIFLAKMPWPQAIAFTAHDVHPPLYYLMLHLWIRVCGDAALSARMFSALFGIATVPLIYVVGKRTLGERVGLITALLATLSPLCIYYSREARMYTLLTFLSLLSSYIMLRITDEHCTTETRASLWVAYLVTALMASYVHYFAFLILVVHAAYFFVWWLARGRQLHCGRHAVTIAVLWAFAYSPWFPVLVQRYVKDTGYWQGSMHPFETLRRSFIGFSVGQTVKQPLAWTITLGYLMLLTVSVLWLPHSGRDRNGAVALHPWLFLSIHLVLPMLMLCVLYWCKPRVSPRHFMLVSPAFLLLIAAAIDGLWRRGIEMVQRAPSRLFKGSAVVAVCFVLATTGYSDYNLFFSRNMRKPDFRGAVSYVCQKCNPDETVVLVAGHMFPVFDYYCSGRERHPLPDDPVLRLDDMIGLHVIETLQDILSGRRGVWLLQWQHRIVDPRGIVPSLLLSQGSEIPVPQSFPGVGIRHFHLSPGAEFRWDTSLALPVQARWEHAISLLEAKLNDDTLQHGEDIQLTLFWRADQPVDRSYTVFTHLVNERGTVWAQDDSYPANDTRQTNTWEPREIIEDRHLIRIHELVPLGEYDLVIGFYFNDGQTMPRLSILDEAENKKADSLFLARVRVVET